MSIIRIQNLNGSDDFNFYSGHYDKKLEVNPGQLLFAWSGNRGTSFGPYIWKGPFGLLNYHTWKVQIRGSAIGKEFFFHALKQLTRFVEGWAHGASALVHVQKWQMEGFQLALPPTKAEQEAIAGALSDADAFIESLAQLIAKKCQLKQGAMQELLRPKDGWCEKKLEDIAEVIDPHPSHRAPPEVPDGIPFVGIGDLNEDGDLVGTKIRTVAQSVFAEHSLRYSLEEGLIGLGRVASIGKVVRLKPIGDKYVISPTLGVIRGTTVRRDYLLYALKSRAVTSQFTRIMSGSTRSSVGMVVLRKLNVPLPADKTEQTAIATVLSDMDSEIAALEEKLAKARHIKQGMMQELLTGRIRLV